HGTLAGQWPPADAEAVDVGTLYPDMAEQGYGYGPAFHGVRAVWRRDGEVFAEVSLPDPARTDAAAFGLHPALLDAALHPADHALAGEDLQGTWIPFCWNGVTLHATGAATVRVHITARGRHELAVALADPAGRPVAAVDSLLLRVVSGDQLKNARRDPLLSVQWQPLPLPGTALDRDAEPIDLADAIDLATMAGLVGATAPAVTGSVLYRVPATPDGDVPAAVRAVATQALEVVRTWITEEPYAQSRLVVVTRGGAAAPGADVDLGQAPVWGLVRSAEVENPGRFVLVDSDGTEASEAALTAALATGEPEIALRDGQAYIPRLAAVPQPETPREQPWCGTGRCAARRRRASRLP
ncbi:polyketide synthase dehydratase domain-containing protein, partial [Streptomyces carpinensis]